MTNKQRVLNALEGNPVDRCPVTSLYNFLYQLDHFSELTGLPQWRLHEWLATDPGRHVELQARGFILSTASPITPATPLARVQRFLELGRQQGAGL